MKCSLAVLTVGILLLGAAAPPDADVKKEIEKFQGTWKFVSMEFEGQKAPEDAFKNFRMVIKGDKFSVTEAGVNFSGTFKVDPTKKPKTIDATFTEGPDKGTTLLGIYELEGDTYKICASPSGPQRPTEFATKAGTGHVLQVLTREKK